MAGATAIAEIQFADYIFPAFDQVGKILIIEWTMDHKVAVFSVGRYANAYSSINIF